MNPWTSLISELDQDEARADVWWKETSTIDKIRVWLIIQREEDDPYMEAVSRLAQLAMLRLAIKNEGPQPSEDENA